MWRITLAAMIVTVLASAVWAAEEKPTVRKHWFVSGRVQGVSFRAFTYESATDLKLRGWVRNLTDGRVEIVVDGDEKAVAQLLEKVKKGPEFAKVEAVKDAKPDAGEKLADKFEIRDSAAPPK